MQLTIEVLPAPLGPMIENSSPSFTPKLTSVSARTPPKRSDTPRTSKACSTHFLRLRRLWRSLARYQLDQACSLRPVNRHNIGTEAGLTLRRRARIWRGDVTSRPIDFGIRLPAIPCARSRLP